MVESNARDWVGMGVVLNSVSALRSSVPNLDLAISGSSHDHVVARRDSNGENISRVSNKLAEGSASLNIP
mgnify:CR=1 FL=1